MPPLNLFKVNLGGPQLTPEYRALIMGKSWNLKEPNQGVLDMYSTQINAFEGMILRLRRKFNAKLAIFRIPSEILSEIFLYCIDGEFTSNSLYTPRTFNFIHVCWYWKVVAYDTPHLWSTWPGGCIDAWPILYARSKSAPLNIHLRKCPTDPTILVPILSDPDTSKRLRSFDFRGHASLFEQFLEYLLAHHQGTFPNLQDLRIDISCTGALTGCEAFRHITRFISSSFPKLNILELINLGINWNTAFPSLSSIVELTIRNPLNVNRPKMDQLVSLLGCNPRMKKLILDDDGALPQPDDTGNKGGFLGLPDLRVLHLNGNLLPTMDLLEHLLLPPELQHISVSVEATGSTEAILPHLKPFLTSYYLSEDREERKIDGLRLAIDELQTSILTIATTPNALSTSEATVSQIPLPPMSLHIQTYQDKRPLSMDVFQFLPLGNLRDLSLESLEFTVQQCRLLFGQVRRLEELCVSGSSGPGGIAALELPIPPSQDKDKEKEAGAPVSSTKRQKGKMKSGKAGGQGYGRRQTGSSTSQNRRQAIAADSVPLPKLKRLVLCEVVFGEGKKRGRVSKTKFVKMVRERKKAGYGLREVGVQGCVGFGERQVKECEKIVKVVWDGDYGEEEADSCAHHHHYWDPDDLSPSEEYEGHYQIYGPWEVYDSDAFEDYLPYF